MAFIIRRAEERDLPAIREIFNYAVRELPAVFEIHEVSLEERAAWFAAHGDRYPIYVAEEARQVVGWGSLSPYKPRPAWRFSVEDSLYVDPAHGGRGIGTRLLQTLIDRARALGYHAVIAEISADNRTSIRLHARVGFQQTGYLREVGWKFARWHDVVTMECLLNAGHPPATA